MSSILFYKTRNQTFFEKNFSKKLHTQKNGPSEAPGLASASPWRAKVSQCRKTKRGDPLRFFNIHSVAKHEKIEENKNFNFREKISQCRKKLKGGPFGIFQHPFCRIHQKIAGGAFGENFFSRKKSHSSEKNERGDPLVSPGMVCYAEKQEKLFWFSSLDQIVQFGAIKFCRTFKNYFGQFVWIEKSHYNSRVSLHEAPTKKHTLILLNSMNMKLQQEAQWRYF